MRIDWQKIHDYVATHDVTPQQIKDLTLFQVARFLYPAIEDGTEVTTDVDGEQVTTMVYPEETLQAMQSVKRSASQILEVIKQDMIEKVKAAKFQQAKTFIEKADPSAVVERSGDDVILKEYL